jgi:predicted nucleic acid-binding protein
LTQRLTHLDADFLIRSLVPGTPEDLLLKKWLRARDSIAVSAIAWTQFLCGPLESVQMELLADVVGDPIPYTVEDAALAARLFNQCGRRRGSLADCMIAATAMREDATLATCNLADFRKMEPHGLRIAGAA